MTHFDLHMTLRHLAVWPDRPPPPLGGGLPPPGLASPPHLGTSLLLPVPPNRSCKEMGVPAVYCFRGGGVRERDVPFEDAPLQLQRALARTLGDAIAFTAALVRRSGVAGQCHVPQLSHLPRTVRRLGGEHAVGWVVSFLSSPPAQWQVALNASFAPDERGFMETDVYQRVSTYNADEEACAGPGAKIGAASGHPRPHMHCLCRARQHSISAVAPDPVAQYYFPL